MDEYECTFYVDGIRTEEIVKAYGSSDARKLIEARYPNSKIKFSSIQHLHRNQIETYRYLFWTLAVLSSNMVIRTLDYVVSYIIIGVLFFCC